MKKSQAFQSPKKVLLFSMLANIVEYYDFALYGFLFPLLSPLFFPPLNLNPIGLGAAIFGIGFLARPLGALAFGYIGDLYGRRTALSLSMSLMALSMIGIAALPTYESVGLFSTCFLVFFRLLQGMSSGGEGPSAIVYILESMKPGQKGLSAALIGSSSLFGIILAAFSASLISQQGASPYLWRYGFLLGGSIGIISYWLRKKLHETPDFLKAPPRKPGDSNPLIVALKTTPKLLLSVSVISLLTGVIQVTFVSYMTLYLTQVVGIPLSRAAFLNAICLIIYAIFFVLPGWLSERIPPARLILGGNIAFFLSIYPIFLLLFQGTTASIVSAHLWFGAVAAFYIAPKNMLFFSFFPTSTRLSSISFGYAIGLSLSAGTTTNICLWMVKNGFSPAFYMMACSLVSLIPLIWLNIQGKNPCNR